MSGLKAFVRDIVEKPWLRVGLAVLLLIAGLAPVGAPILSDSTFQRSLRPSPAQPQTATVSYQSLIQPDGSTRIQRSRPAGQANG